MMASVIIILLVVLRENFGFIIFKMALYHHLFQV